MRELSRKEVLSHVATIEDAHVRCQVIKKWLDVAQEKGEEFNEHDLADFLWRTSKLTTWSISGYSKRNTEQGHRR